MCRVKLDMERCRRTVAHLIAKKLGTMSTGSDEYVGLVAEVEYLRVALERALSLVGWGDKTLDGTGRGLVNGGDPPRDAGTAAPNRKLM